MTSRTLSILVVVVVAPLLAATTCGPGAGTSHIIRTNRAARVAAARDLGCDVVDARVGRESDTVLTGSCVSRPEEVIRYECIDPCPELECDPDAADDPCPAHCAVECSRLDGT